MIEITPNKPDGSAYPVKINESELAKKVDPLSFEVLRRGGTEVAFTGEYTDTETIGVYKCKACSAELFRSDTKFHSGCGWPSFYAPTKDDSVILLEDRSLATRNLRNELRCEFWAQVIDPLAKLRHHLLMVHKKMANHNQNET